MTFARGLGRRRARLVPCALALLLACSEERPDGPQAMTAPNAVPPATSTAPASTAGSAGSTAPSTPSTMTTPPSAGAGSGGSSANPTPDAGLPPVTQADAAAPQADAATMPAPQVMCPTTVKPPGDHSGSVEFGGHMRTYSVHLPRGYTGREAVPLIFDFHGYGQPISSQQRASGFADLSETENFAVVYPAGVGGSWHVNGCCGQAAQEKLDEVGAVRAILQRIQSEVCVDPKRIYASGISQGGGMAHHVGCLAADVFAAVAPVSSDLRTDPCMPSRPISELSFRGTADTLSAYEGGPVGPPGGQYQSIGAKPTLERWRTINGCSGTPKVSEQFCETYDQCTGGVEVTLCSIPNGAHALYSNPARFELAKFAWAMFERQRLP